VNLLELVASSKPETVTYSPPGPEAQRFHQATGFVRGLMGPVGSGKSSSCCIEIVYHSLRQKPYRGVRHARWAVIRNTFPELKSTTIKTWQMWFPDTIAPIKWDSPITSTMRVPDIGDGTALELEVMFIALDSPDDTGKLRSLELTGAWINECSEVPKEVFDMLTQRVGRFPPKSWGGPVDTGVILDTNPPDDDHWYYRFAEEETPPDWKFFRQPGALIYTPKDRQQLLRLDSTQDVDDYTPNPNAENVHNISNGYQYWFNQIPGKNQDWINVFLLGKYGTTADGKPVYPEFDDSVHVAKNPLRPIQGARLFAGWDFGLTPACIVGQITPRGQLQILREYVADDMGIRQFARSIVKPALINEFPLTKIESACDPAGNTRSQIDEKTCVQELLEAGIYTEIASSNDFIQRREAVAYFLTQLNEGQPGFLLDPSCSQLRKGFNGKYRYERIRAAGERYKDRPLKDQFSHPHDGLQYLCMRIRAAMNPVRARPVKLKEASGWT
jgi:hypothetical protein